VLHWLPKPISFRPLVDMLKAATRPNRACPRVLHIDDDSNVLALVAEELRPTVEVVSASSAEKALQVLATERIDLIVLDISLGQDSGIDLLPELRDVAGNVIPVIVFSNQVRQIETDEHIDDEQISSALSKMDSPLESLAAAVRDRLSLPGAQPVKEVA
jgi:CheY-like chemotaxis protein